MIKLRNVTLALAAAGAAMLLTGLARAETFSFTSTTEVTSQILIPMPTGVVDASTWFKGSSSGVFSKRGEVSSTFVCSSMTNPPNETFAAGTRCDVTEKDGSTFAIYAGCNFVNKERTESICLGGLIGKTGAYKDRAGTISWNQKQSGPSTGAATGAGVWNE